MNAVRFKQEAVQMLIQKIWKAEKRRRTEIDARYDTGSPNGLPVITLCVEDYGIYLTGNAYDIDDSEEVWAIDYDPNEQDEESITFKVREMFGETPQRFHFHLMNYPQDGDVFNVAIDEEGVPMFQYIQGSLLVERSINELEDFFWSR